MRAPIIAEDLLSLAETLADATNDSTTVHLRRATSSAYYALFHGLIGDATTRLTGPDPTRDRDRHTLSRWYSHAEMRTVCQWVIRLTRGGSVPNGVADLLAPSVPQLADVARAFIQLQEARHEADYDHRADLDVADAFGAIGTARDALAHLPALAGGRVYDNYLVLLLGGPKLTSR